jgi:hypothetical protein
MTASPIVMEVLPGSVSGAVQIRDTGLAGVTIELRDSRGQVVSTAQTNAGGRYRFDEVWPGTYSLRELSPPGTLHGLVGPQEIDNVHVLSGIDLLVDYDFTEEPIAAVPPPVPPVDQASPITTPFPLVLRAVMPAPMPTIVPTATLEIPGSHTVGGEGFRWRLSLLGPSEQPESPLVWRNASFQANKLRSGRWLLGDAHAEADLGSENGTPLVGDFNGDGREELAIFLAGEWFIDNNDNGRWDDDDRTIKLGAPSDQAVVGDWNGDGRDDVGVYGPASESATRPAGAIPIAGDFTGSGKHSIGLFHAGQWRLDTDGDRQLTASDSTVHFGQSGDVPIVGDFDGDGRDEIGVFREGRWIIDSNHNGQIDASDKVFELGATGDIPIVGDFNGDGIDEPGLYRAGPVARVSRTP